MPRATSSTRKACQSVGTPLARLGEHVSLDAPNVAQAPASPGVYLLYRGHRLMYIGVAANGDTIRQRLQQHLAGACRPSAQSTPQFDYETAEDALPLYWFYLNIYREMTGGLLPECNE